MTEAISDPDEKTGRTMHLSAGFETKAEPDWITLAEKALRGRGVESALRSETPGGIAFDALGVPGRIVPEMQPAGRQGAWDIVARHWDPDAAQANTAILSDLEGGATALELRLRAGMVPGIASGDLDRALENVLLDLIHLRLMPGEEIVSAGEAVMAILQARGLTGAAKGALGADPLAALARNGRLLTSAEEALSSAAGFARRFLDEVPGYRAFAVDPAVYHTAGADEVMELGLTIATAVQYLRAMEAEGLSLDAASAQIELGFVAEADWVLTLAKGRSLRRLWTRVLQACGVDTGPARVFAIQSLRMMTVYDPWVNILRSASAAFGAGLSGADSVTLLPHDTLHGLPGAAARRLSRNISVILMEESHLHRVRDPAAGASGIEDITSKITHKVWEYFQNIEKEGGALTALRSGRIARDCIAGWTSRARDVARRALPVTGVSSFPLLDEKKTRGFGPAPLPPRRDDLPAAVETLQPLPFHRDAEDFERLRHRAEETAPSVFLAALGPKTGHLPRTRWTANAFATAGFHTVESGDGMNTAAIAQAFKASGAPIAVLSGPDTLYDEDGGLVISALVGAGAKGVYIAGRRKDEEHLKSLGLTACLYEGMDFIAVLGDALDRAGIPASKGETAQ